ncbi:MAG: acyl carrier protein [Hyphomicrobiales bacterium]|nr:acyl carrier protein [Hyphomicrobiales bacterium]
MDVQAIVFEEIAEVAARQKKTLQPFNVDSPLLGIGLDSLCFAILVARLEERFGVDPFEDPENDSMPMTIGDLVNMYERVVA